MAGRPSGTAATAMLTAVRNMMRTPSPRSRPVTKMTITNAKAAIASQRPSWLNRFCRGVVSRSTFWIIPAILPSSVSMPVATMTASPLPCEADVPMKSMLMRSASGSSSWVMGLSIFSTGSDSPVSAASWTRRLAEWSETGIGGYDVTGFDEDYVSRHKICCRRFSHLAVAPHAYDRGGQLSQGAHGLLGLVFLPETQSSVEDDDGHDDDGIFVITERRRYHRRDDQNDDQDAR